MINTIIIDDELHALGNLEFLLQKHCSYIHIAAMCSEPDEAVEQVRQIRPDLLLLDIEMPGENGFSILEQVKEVRCEVVFVTGYEQFALRAFKHDALGYLLKPVDTRELVRTMEKVKQLVEWKNGQKTLVAEQRQTGTRLAIPAVEGISFVDIPDIIYCASEGRYTEIHLSGGKKITVSKNLGTYEKMLEPHRFIRLHNEYLVNPAFIQQYVRGRGGFVVLKNGLTIGVSARRKELFLQQFPVTGLNG